MFKGVIPVIPTPFSVDGDKIQYDAFERVIEAAIQEGASSIMLFGAGGEFYKLTEQEKMELLRKALAVCKGRISVAATVSFHATRQAVREAEQYRTMGAELINIIPPSFAAPTGNMVKTHILEVAAAVRGPIMVQYAPALTGGLISNETFATIADFVGGELYIKIEATPTGPAITSVIEATGGKYRVVIGNGGECIYEAWERGAVGVMPGAAAVKPYSDIINAYESGNCGHAWKLYCTLLPYLHFSHRHIEEFVQMEKTILRMRGIFNNNVCRRPDMEMDAISKQLLEKIYKQAIDPFYKEKR